MSVTLHVLRVFTDAGGSHGNPLGVFLDGGAIPPAERQAVAADLGYSETVFVDDRESGRAAIFTPGTELGFAGHPSVGTAWLLAEEDTPVDSLLLKAGEIPTWREDDLTWVRAHPDWGPQYDLFELGSAEEVEALAEPPNDRAYVWAWQDEESGIVRSRCFPVYIGIPEDEATGGAATIIVSRLGRELRIRQGRGSEISARPAADGFAEIGGRAVLDEVRDYG